MTGAKPSGGQGFLGKAKGNQMDGDVTAAGLERALRVLIIERSGIAIWHFPNKTSNGWESFKVETPYERGRPKNKRNFWLGWNGERLAVNTDTESLIKHHPTLYELIISELNKWTFMRD